MLLHGFVDVEGEVSRVLQASRVLFAMKGEVFFIVSKHVDVHDSNESTVLVIFKTLLCFSKIFLNMLIMESDSSNVI